MKKTSLLITLLIMMFSSKAQFHCDSIENHSPLNPGEFNLWPCGVIELNDRSFLSRVALYELDASGSVSSNLGYKYYKITREAVITDSVFIDDDVLSVGIITRNPVQGGVGDSVFSNMKCEVHYENDSSYLRFTCFDDNINFSDDEMLVPLADTFVWMYDLGFLHDSQNSLVVHYAIPTRHETHFARIGFDGALEYEKIIPEFAMPIHWQPRGFKQCGANPPMYNYWGTKPEDGCFIGYVLDSEFNIVACDTLYEKSPQTPPYTNFGWEDRMVSLDVSTFVLCSRYTKYHTPWDPNINFDRGVLVSKYGLGCQLQKWLFFETIPEQPSTCGAVPIELKKTDDGHIMMAYSTTLPFCDEGLISIVKMDEDLNVVWQRFCMESYRNRGRWGVNMELLDDGGIVMNGVNYGDYEGSLFPVGFFFLILTGEGQAISAKESFVRPYAFYPNPVNDILNLQYSPDIIPAQIELYDLQGRMVRSQRNSLESLNMQGLASGTYTMRVMLEDGKVFSDKVVKE